MPSTKERERNFMKKIIIPGQRELCVYINSNHIQREILFNYPMFCLLQYENIFFILHRTTYKSRFSWRHTWRYEKTDANNKQRRSLKEAAACQIFYFIFLILRSRVYTCGLLWTSPASGIKWENAMRKKEL